MMDELYIYSWIRSDKGFWWGIALILPLALIGSCDMIRYLEIVELFLSLGSPEILDET
jgi:hypothetical protein